MLVSIGSGNGLVPILHQANSEPMLPYYQWDPPKLKWGLHMEMLSHIWNTSNLVCGVATVYHQVRCMSWGILVSFIEALPF